MQNSQIFKVGIVCLIELKESFVNNIIKYILGTKFKLC